MKEPSVSAKARGLKFGLSLHLRPYFAARISIKYRNISTLTDVFSNYWISEQIIVTFENQAGVKNDHIRCL